MTEDGTLLAEYPLESSSGFLVVLVLVAGLSALVIGLMLTLGARAPLQLWLLAALPPIALAAYVMSAAAHRVVGGKGALRIFADSLEVPAAFSGPPMRFDNRHTKIDVRVYTGRMYGTQVSEVRLLEIVSAQGGRKLSSRLFESMEDFERAVDDVGRALRGLPLRDHDADDEPVDESPEERDKYDRQLDEELSAID